MSIAPVNSEAVLNATSPSKPELTSNQSDVIIVGAGIAGISCAYHLLVELDYPGNVILLEALDRTGGRVHSDSIGTTQIEHGANFIHGLVGNPIYGLATKIALVDPVHEKGSNLSELVVSDYMLTSDGDPAPHELVEPAFAIYYEALEKSKNIYEAIELGNVTLAKSNDTVGRLMRYEVEKYLNSLEEAKRASSRSIFNNLFHHECIESACDNIDQLSLSYFGAYQELEGGDIFITRGYKQILDFLINGITEKLQAQGEPNRFRLILNSPVQKIRWPGLNSNSTHSPSSVTTQNGAVYQAPHVVTTFPMGVLKASHQHLFEPQLPRYKVDSIERIGFGTVNKIFLHFNESISAQVNNSNFDSHENILIFWMGNSTGPDWTSNIYTITKVNDQCLLLWLAGETARLVETLDRSQVETDVMVFLRKALKTPNLSDPTEVIVTNWHSNPYSQGSYSYIAKGSSTEDHERLGLPIYSSKDQKVPNLLFAGEACHPTFFSTVHGAYLTGVKAALHLTDLDQL